MSEDDLTQIDPLIRRAARLRVAGRTWGEVAKEVDRAVSTVRHWPYKRTEQWSEAMRDAIDDALPEYEFEALTICRRNMRGGDDKLSQRAASDLLTHCRQLRGTLHKLEGSLEHRFDGENPLELLLKMPEEQLDAIIEAGERDADDT